MLSRRKNGEKEKGFVAKLRQGAAELLDNPEVRKEVRRGAKRLAEDPRVRRAVQKWASRAAQRLRR